MASTDRFDNTKSLPIEHTSPSPRATLFRHAETVGGVVEEAEISTGERGGTRIALRTSEAGSARWAIPSAFWLQPA